jgi:hypothetical protein
MIPELDAATQVAMGYLLGILAEGKRCNFGQVRAATESNALFIDVPEEHRRHAFNVALAMLTVTRDENGDCALGAVVLTRNPETGKTYLVLRSEATEEEIEFVEEAHNSWFAIERARLNLKRANDLRPPYA